MATELESYALWREEKREVSVIFADLSGYSEMSARLDVEMLGRTLKEIHRELAGIVNRHGGMVAKVVGDCLMAVFGAPVSSGEEIPRAGFAALEMKKWVETVGREKFQVPGIKIGMNHGVVFTASLEAGLTTDYTFLGEAVNVADQLYHYAHSGQILVPEQLAEKMQNIFYLEFRNVIPQKGTEKPLHIYEVMGAKKGLDQFPLQPLIGRKVELGFCDSALIRCLTGRGLIIGVLGSEGKGKRAFAAHVLDMARRKGFITSGVACYAFRKNIPFYVISQLIAGLIDAPILSKKFSREEYEFLQAMALRTSPPTNNKGESAETKELWFSLSKKALISIAEEVPLFLLISGYQNADAFSREFLLLFSYTLPRFPVCLLLTYQPGTEIPFRGKEYFYEITLRNWDKEGIAEAIKFFLPEMQGEERFVEKVLEWTDGNPALVRNLLGRLRLSDLKKEDALVMIGVKKDEQQWDWMDITALLDQLTPEAKEVLTACSILPQEFPYRQLKRMVPERLNLDKAILELLEKELLRESRFLPEPVYTFLNREVQRFIENRLLRDQRRKLHLKAAEALVEIFADSLKDHYDEIAFHYEKAEDFWQALNYYLKAAESSRAKFAPREAKKFFDSARDIMDTAQIHLDYPRLSQFYCGCGEVERLLGNFACSDECYQTLRELAKQNNDRKNEIKALLELGDNCTLKGDLPSAEHLFQQAEQACSDSEFLDLKSYAIAKIGRVRYMKGEKEGVRELLLQALQLAQQIKDRKTEAMTYNYLGLYQRRFESIQDALNSIEKAYQIYEEMNHLEGIASALLNLGIIYEHIGDMEKDLQVNLKALEISENIGDLYTVASSTHNVGVIYLATGRVQEAILYLLKSLEIQKSLGDVLSQSLTLSNLGDCYLQIGEMEKTARVFMEGIQLGRQGGSAFFTFSNQLGLAEFYLRIGDYPEAERLLMEISEKCRKLEQEFVLYKALLLMAENYIAQKKWEKAEALLTEHQNYFEFRADISAQIDYALLKAILSFQHHQNPEESQILLHQAAQLAEKSQDTYKQCRAGILRYLYFEEDVLPRVDELIEQGDYVLLKLQKLLAQFDVAKRKGNKKLSAKFQENASALLAYLADKFEHIQWRNTFLTTSLQHFG